MATTTLPAKKKGVASYSIGLKYLMAGTGVIFILYVLLHMYGNLKVFAGQAAFDDGLLQLGLDHGHQIGQIDGRKAWGRRGDGAGFGLGGDDGVHGGARLCLDGVLSLGQGRYFKRLGKAR